MKLDFSSSNIHRVFFLAVSFLISAFSFFTNAAEQDTITEKVTELSEVVVTKGKSKYSKKNNPAVDLMRRLRSDGKFHDPVGKLPYYGYDRYDKIVFAINDFNGYMPGNEKEQKGINRSIVKFIDTAIWSGKRILDLSIKEKLSSRITTSGGVDKEIVFAQRSNGIDGALDEGYTRQLIEDFMGEIDLYQNDISILRNRFVSPLSAIGADFYKYQIEDTVYIGKDRCIELSFVPHNLESAGFTGSLFIPVEDSVKYVRRAMFRLPKAANVNYIENLYLSQNFRKDSLGYVHKKLDDMVLELHLVGSVGRLHLSRQSRYDNVKYQKNKELESFYTKIGDKFALEEAPDRTADYWNENRMLPLSYAESNFSTDSSPYKDIPLLYWTTRILEILVKGYIQTSKNSKFDFGPIDTFISYNYTEGLRLSVGGLTTANLSDKLFGRGYVAYGFKDRKWKYHAELEYSFVKKKYHAYEFPLYSLRLSYKFDTSQVGQRFLSSYARSVFNSFSRVHNDLNIYERHGKLEYNIEWLNHLSLHASLNYKRDEPSRFVNFIRGNGSSASHFNQNSIKLQLRWAPGEKFMQTYVDRHVVNRDALTILLSHEFGPKGLFGSESTLNLTEFLVQKRIWFSAFGYTDIIFKMGKLWNQVQFPSLLWQNSNISYTVQPETYSLLNPMEFAMDQYVSIDLSYNLNGLIFNRIPYLKKLRLREVFTFKGFYGSLTKKNNPELNENLFRFPEIAGTRLMGKSPYMEIGVGIDNILTFLRLDYVWRLSYFNTPGAPNSGLRFGLHFSF